jgi:hypothetical protein
MHRTHVFLVLPNKALEGPGVTHGKYVCRGLAIMCISDVHAGKEHQL